MSSDYLIGWRELSCNGERIFIGLENASSLADCGVWVGVCAAACLLERVIYGMMAEQLFVTDVIDDGLAAINNGDNGV